MGRGRVQPGGTPTRRSGRLPASPSNSLLPPRTTTIHDLPLEIIGRIITIAHIALPVNPNERRERDRFLKATSLVCREWTPFAQEALWLDVSLCDQAIRTFLEAGAGRHATHKLSVNYGSGGDAIVEAILRNVRGVRDLELGSCTVSMDWLCGDNFKGLEMLRLTDVTESAASTSNLLPFALTKLKLAFEENPSSSSLIDALSRQSSITSLRVVTHGFEPTTLLTLLAPLAPGLDTLDISLRDVPGAADDFLQGCTHLKHLDTSNVPLNTVKHVAASLVSWTIQYVPSYELSTLLDVLETGSIATGKLEKLVLEYCSVRKSPRWAELVTMCKEKKIKLIEMEYNGNSEIIV